MATPAEQFGAFARGYLQDARQRATVAVDGSTRILLEEMRALTARIDHDLEALRRLGHPYGRRFAGTPPHPDWVLHLQSGALQAGLGREPVVLQGGRVTGAIRSRADHTNLVLYGTRRMRPRDFVTAAVLLRQDAVGELFRRVFELDGGLIVGVIATDRAADARLPGG